MSVCGRGGARRAVTLALACTRATRAAAVRLTAAHDLPHPIEDHALLRVEHGVDPLTDALEDRATRCVARIRRELRVRRVRARGLHLGAPLGERLADESLLVRVELEHDRELLEPVLHVLGREAAAAAVPAIVTSAITAIVTAAPLGALAILSRSKADRRRGKGDREGENENER